MWICLYFCSEYGVNYISKHNTNNFLVNTNRMKSRANDKFGLDLTATNSKMSMHIFPKNL